MEIIIAKGECVDLSELRKYLQVVSCEDKKPVTLVYLIPAEIQFSPNEERLNECFEQWGSKPCAGGDVIFTVTGRRFLNYIWE